MKTKTFDGWMKLVNQALLLICGLSADDLVDCPYYDWYEDGVTPKVAAKRAIKMNGGY